MLGIHRTGPQELSGNVDLVATAASFSALFSADHQRYE
jgi:hypothetical protein